MASEVDVSKKYPSETVLSTLSNNFVIPHARPEFGPTVVRKYPEFYKSKSVTKNVEALNLVKDKGVNHIPQFYTKEIQPKQFSFLEFYQNLMKHDVKCKLKYLRKSLKDDKNKKYASYNDITRFAAHLPFMTNRDKDVDQILDFQQYKSKDFFDDAIMEHVRHHLLQLSSIESVVTSGPPAAITFHSKVMGKRKVEAGKVHYLLRWSPENIVPDTWVAEDEVNQHTEKTIPVSQLPSEALQLPVMDALGLSGIFSKPGKRKRK